MNVVVFGEYAAKSNIVGKKAIEQYRENVEIDGADGILFEARAAVTSILKSRDPKFAFLRTCFVAPESEHLVEKPAAKKKSFNPKDFDPKTGRPHEVSSHYIAGDAAQAEAETTAQYGAEALTQDIPTPKRGRGRKE